MGVKISFISESISIMVIDLFRFDSGFSFWEIVDSCK